MSEDKFKCQSISRFCWMCPSFAGCQVACRTVEENQARNCKIAEYNAVFLAWIVITFIAFVVYFVAQGIMLTDASSFFKWTWNLAAFVLLVVALSVGIMAWRMDCGLARTPRRYYRKRGVT